MALTRRQVEVVVAIGYGIGMVICLVGAVIHAYVMYDHVRDARDAG